MFLPPLSLSRILPAVMLSSGIWNLLTYNNSLDRSGGWVFCNLIGPAKVELNRAARSTQPFGGSRPNDIEGLVVATLGSECWLGNRLRSARVA
jgi:hypothetical protein